MAVAEEKKEKYVRVYGGFFALSSVAVSSWHIFRRESLGLFTFVLKMEEYMDYVFSSFYYAMVRGKGKYREYALFFF